MKKILVTISALGTLGLVGAGIGLRVENALEVSADPVLSRVFISGDMNSWLHDGKTIEQIDNAYRFQYDGYRDGYYYYSLNISLTQGTGFKLVDWEDGHSVDWMEYWNSENIQGFSGGNGGGDIYCRLTGDYHLVYRFQNKDEKQLYTATLTDYKTIYFVDGISSWIDSNQMHLHAWKGSEGAGNLVNYTNWNEGCTLNALDITFGETNYKLYSAKVPTDTESVIFKAYTGNTDYKTGILAATDLAGYYAGDVANYGAAGPIVGRVIDEMGSTDYKGKSYAKSICAVTASTASAVVTAYEGAGDGLKTVLDAVTVNTYDVVNGGTTNVTFPSIIEVLGRMTNPTNISVSFSSEGDKTFVTWIFAIGVASIASVGGLFLLRKRKAE